MMATVFPAMLIAMAVGQSPDTTPPRELSRIDLEAWLDGFMPYALKRGDIAGGIVVVVKDGSVLLQKGYGFADVARRIPVDPERTVFRPGSVAKLVTWTAVMQMVEQGKLALDRDINDYLDFAIPPLDGRPITLRHLMTHTPGFEEALKSLITDDPEALLPLDAYLRQWVPTRIFAPGTVPAYSNYGVTLAGYLVARVSGESFDDYLDRHIFGPLGMAHSTFRQPLPDHLRDGMSKGYTVGSGPAKDYELVGPAPAGSMAATGADMGRFMIAHLGAGAYDTARILKPETVRQMHGTAMRFMPSVHHMLLGFFDRSYDGRRIIGHEGDTQYFHSMLDLFPDDGVGVFLSVNSTGKEGAAGPIRAELLEQFTDRYFPAPPDARLVDSATAAEHARMLAGRYESSRRAETSFMSLTGLPGQVKVVPTAEGSISVPVITGTNGQPKQWREVEPFVWREVGGHERLAAKVDDGRVVMWSIDQLSPFTVFQPIPWWRSGAWLIPALLASFVVLALTLLAWLIGSIARRRYRVAPSVTGVEARGLLLMRMAALAILAVLVAWAITIAPIGSNLGAFGPGLDPWIRALRILSLVVFAGAVVAAVWNASRVWRGERGRFARFWSVMQVGAVVTVLWMAVAFRLVGFGVDY